MHEDVAKSGDRGEALCKLTRKNSNVPQHLYRAVGVAWLLLLFHGDDPIGNIDARLRRNLEVALYYVLEVGFLVVPSRYLKMQCETKSLSQRREVAKEKQDTERKNRNNRGCWRAAV